MSEIPETMLILPVRQPSVKRKDGRRPLNAYVPKDAEVHPALLEFALPRTVRQQALGHFAVERIREHGYEITEGGIIDVFTATVEPRHKFAIVRGVKRPCGAEETLEETSLFKVIDPVLKLNAPGIYPEINAALARAGNHEGRNASALSTYVGRRAVYRWLLSGGTTREKEIIDAMSPWLERVFSEPFGASDASMA